jgi:hypothetical protein
MRRRPGLILGVVLAAAAIMSCTGKEGPQGPPGTANVISGRDTVSDADWSTTTIQAVVYMVAPTVGYFARPARYVDLDVPEIDAAVLGGGEVLVWMQPRGTADSTNYVLLPWTFLWISSSLEYHYDPLVSPGSIRVIYYKVDLNDPTTLISPLSDEQATRIFRWVVIPPAAMAVADVSALAAQSDPDVVLAMLAARGVHVEGPTSVGP